MCGALVEHGKVNRSLTAGVTIDRILRDYPHGVSCCHDSHALESCWRLACQVDLAAVDHHGETALHMAIRSGSVDWYGDTCDVFVLIPNRNFGPASLPLNSQRYQDQKNWINASIHLHSIDI